MLGSPCCAKLLFQSAALNSFPASDRPSNPTTPAGEPVISSMSEQLRPFSGEAAVPALLHTLSWWPKITWSLLPIAAR